MYPRIIDLLFENNGQGPKLDKAICPNTTIGWDSSTDPAGDLTKALLTQDFASLTAAHTSWKFLAMGRVNATSVPTVVWSTNIASIARASTGQGTITLTVPIGQGQVFIFPIGTELIVTTSYIDTSGVGVISYAMTYMNGNTLTYSDSPISIFVLSLE